MNIIKIPSHVLQPHLRSEEILSDRRPIYVGTFRHEVGGTGWHDHDFWEIALVLQGKGWHRSLEHQRRLHRGDLYLIPPRFSHLYTVESTQQVSNLLFTDAVAKSLLGVDDAVGAKTPMRMLGECFETPAFLMRRLPAMWTLPPGPFDFMRRLFLDMQGHCLEDDAHPRLLLRMHLVELLLRLARWEMDKQTGVLGTANPRRPAYVDAIRSHIQDHYHEPIRLEQLADHAGVDRSHLIRVFKRETGYPVMEYIRAVRVEHACRLLRGTQRPVAEIAMEVGFGTLAFFNRIFLRSTGLTPRQYRKINSVSVPP